MWARGRVRAADWLIFLAFALAALLSAYRNIILIGLFAPVVIAAYCAVEVALAVRHALRRRVPA